MTSKRNYKDSRLNRLKSNEVLLELMKHDEEVKIWHQCHYGDESSNEPTRSSRHKGLCWFYIVRNSGEPHHVLVLRPCKFHVNDYLAKGWKILL